MQRFAFERQLSPDGLHELCSKLPHMMGQGKWPQGAQTLAHLAPLLPASEQARLLNIQTITASAPGATAQGAMFGNVINYGAGAADVGPHASRKIDPGHDAENSL